MKEKKDKSLSEKIFKLLVILVIIIFSLIIINQPKGNFSFSENKLRQDNSKIKSVETKSNKSIPSELRWFDSFKGISNEKSDSDKKSFLE